MVAHLVFIATGGGIAAYCGQQASDHRHAQRDAAHVALQLAALKPYLNDLDDDAERDQLLIEIAKRLFGQPRTEHVSTTTMFADNPSLLPQLVAALIDQKMIPK